MIKIIKWDKLRIKWNGSLYKIAIILLIVGINVSFLGVRGADPFTKTTNVDPSELDYSMSLIDWYGQNLELSIFWDKVGTSDPSQMLVAIYKAGVLQWTASTWILYETNVGFDRYILDISSEKIDEIKAIIFSRSIDTTDYFMVQFGHDFGDDTPFSVYFAVDTKNLMDVHFSSLYVADEIQPVYDTTVHTTKNIQLFDKSNQPAFNSIRLFDESGIILPYQEKALYTFDNRFSNIGRVEYQIFFDATSTDWSIASYKIFEFGLFANAQIIFADIDVDPQFHIFTPVVAANWYDIGAHLKNFVNSSANAIYNAFNQAQLEENFTGILAIFGVPVAGLPDAEMVAILTLFFSAFMLLILYKIWRKIT